MVIHFLLLTPLIFIIFLYSKNIKNKNKNLFAEAYLGLNVICYCAYYLLAYRIHHSYSDLSEGDFLNGIYIFYILFLSSSFYIYLINKKIGFGDRFINKSNLTILKLLEPRNNINLLILIFFIFGFSLFYINRIAILVCESEPFNLIKDNNLLVSLFQKTHTIGYFGFFLIVCGILLFVDKILKFKSYKLFNGLLGYCLLLTILIFLVLNTSSSVSLIIAYVIISSIIFHTISKKVFFINLFFLTLLIIILSSVKNEIRKEISPLLWNCKLNVLNNSYTIVNKSTNFYKFNKDKKYILENGDYIKTDVNLFRYMTANFLERVDFLQMLSQTHYLSNTKYSNEDNDKLKLKYGATYLNPSQQWQQQFGIDINQLNPTTVSSFNMPASIESYYNFGVIGFTIFSILMGAIIYIISKILNSGKISKELKILLTVTYFPFLNLENHLLFMLKNWIYVTILIFTIVIIVNYINNKLNNRF